MSFEIGQMVTVNFTVKVANVLTTATSVSLLVQDPQGVVTSRVVSPDSVGTYHFDLIPVLAGTHRYRWVSTGVGQGAEESLFTVRPAFSTSVPLSEAKQFLNKDLNRTVDDVELQSFLDAAVIAVEKRCGPLAPQSFTETIYEHTGQLVLRRWPALAIQSVQVAPFLGQAPTDDTAAWVLDTVTGVARRAIVGGAIGYYGRGSVITVTYTAGRSSIPADLVKAVLYVLHSLWTSQRGASPMPSAPDRVLPPYAGQAGFGVPDTAFALMLPYLLPAGVA